MNKVFAFTFVVSAFCLGGCGQTASLEFDHVAAVRESDGRVTVNATVYCAGAGDEDCEYSGCVTASWPLSDAQDAGGADSSADADANADADGGQGAIGSSKACTSGTIKKSHGTDRVDTQTVSVISDLPVVGTPTFTASVDHEGFDGVVDEMTGATPP